ncbi:Reducing polyketide synthase DEP5 [Lachnellula arida]|uniref:Reducing polyketide synthase DEP5 n=1 Tax=Lachnellula arida TaxID=1316785 RepID=A0A8T9BE08_9HELO|nr:Reducing polyketide synthase DEP5 [Lachnellula arida]
MDAVAPVYNELLTKAILELDDCSLEWRQPRAKWISSVTGKEFEGDEVLPEYWSQNLRSRVLFNSAITALGNNPEFDDIRCMVEIGPHSALAGPLKQIWKANNFTRFTYIPTLLRRSDSSHALLETAGNLWVQNYSIDLEAVNAVEPFPQVRTPQKGFSPLILVDLPPYQWNYSKVFRTEPRFSSEQRNIRYGRHDILGSRVVGLSDSSLVWRNMLRHKDVPWLKDHKLGNVAVFPAAGHLSLAIEAVRQVCETEGIEMKGASFRDVAIKTALVIPETEDGIEVHFRLLRMKNKEQNSNAWFSFAVESITDGRWTVHCEGIAMALLESSKHDSMASSPVDTSKLTQHVPSKRWYNAFNRVGFEYGPSFQRLGPIQTDSKYHEAAAAVEIETESRLMQGESRYILHPSTIDACLQLIIISINAGLHKEMPHGVVPVNIEELSLWFPGEEAGTVGSAVAWTDEQSGRYFNTHTKLLTKAGKLILDVTSLRCVSYEAAVPQQTVAERPREPYMQAVWKPDITTLKSPDSSIMAEPVLDKVSEIIELINHKKLLERAIFIGCSTEFLQSIHTRIPSETWVTICDRSSETLDALKVLFESKPRISTRILNGSSFNLEETPLELQDVAFIGDNFAEWESTELLRSIRAVLVGSGKLLSLTKLDGKELMDRNLLAAGFSAVELQFNSTKDSVSCYSTNPHLNGFDTPAETIALVTQSRESPQSLQLAESLSDQDRTVEVVDFTTGFSYHKDQKIVIHDAEGSILSSPSPESFESLKTILLSGASILWLTSGVNEGKNISGAMAQGFLRAIRSEQASVKIILLDVDTDSNPKDISSAVMSKLKTAATKDSGADTEFWLHNGVLEISRIIPNTSLNEQFGGNSKPAEIAPLLPGKALRPVLIDGELVFSQDFLLEQKDLESDEAEVQVNAAEFNLPLESHPRIIAGRIVRVGSKVDPQMVGQEIVTYAASSYSTIVRTPISLTAPTTGFTAEDLVASLSSISNVWNSLVTTAKAQAGDYVLLLSASVKTICLIAAFAQNMGIKLAVVVDSEEQRDVLTTQKIEVESLMLGSERDAIHGLLSSRSSCKPNVVISYDFSELNQDVWRIIPAMGRFVLCDATIDVAPDVLPFARGATFTSTGIETLFKQDRATLGQVLNSSVNILAQFKDVLLNKASNFPISSLKDSVEIAKLKSIDNAVITYDYESDAVKTQPTTAGLRLDAKATYLLVGCLGGLGRSLTTWMMERGATSFAFISRSGADKPEAAQVIESIQKAGHDAQVYRADASDTAEVTKVIKAVSASRPIRGVVHAAMVLQDSMFERMTYSKYMAAVVPKVRGAQSLHTALADAQLDFFVMTSSISATLGNPGQTNYCAANSFLDALAWHRNLNGLPAISLVLPMILDVGVVAENEDIEISLARKAMYGIDEREMLRSFETAMMQPTPSPATASSGNAQIILGLEPAYLAAALSADDAADAYWVSDARLANLSATVKEIQGAGSGRRSESNFASQLKSAVAEGPDFVIQAIASHIMHRCSRILMVALEDFSFDGQSIADYGLDSMIGAELRNWLFKEFELDISFQHLLAPTVTFKKLAHIVAAKIGVLPALE